jgi:hypothetical protein
LQTGICLTQAIPARLVWKLEIICRENSHFRTVTALLPVKLE